MPRSLAGMRRRVSRDTARFLWLSILPVGVALVSLVLSIVSLLAAKQAPDVVLTMPDRVRIAQGGNSAAWLYLQPRFVNTGNNQRNEVIGGLTVEVQPAAGGTPVVLGWDEQGTWLYSTSTNELTWQFLADPAPLVVGPNDPQFPTGLFIAPANWLWQPGRYRITVVAARTVRKQSLRASVEFEITPQQVDAMSSYSGIFFEIPTSPASP
jgi:hypothetical protein